jgi:hypothetical protein
LAAAMSLTLAAPVDGGPLLGDDRTVAASDVLAALGTG